MTILVYLEATAGVIVLTGREEVTEAPSLDPARKEQDYHRPPLKPRIFEILHIQLGPPLPPRFAAVKAMKQPAASLVLSLVTHPGRISP